MNYDNWKLQTPPEGNGSFEIESTLSDLRAEQLTIEKRNCKIDELIEEAMKRIEKIKVSEAIPYTVAGGYFERQNDILRYEYIISRLNESIKKNDKRWDELEEQIDELEYKLNNL